MKDDIIKGINDHPNDTSTEAIRNREMPSEEDLMPYTKEVILQPKAFEK
jgi:hypothetical protein